MRSPADPAARTRPPQTLTPPDGEGGARCWVLRTDTEGIDRLLPRASKSVLRMVQLAPGRLRTHLFRFVGRTVDVDGGSTSLPLRATGTTPPGRATVTFLLGAEGRFASATHEFAPRSVVVWPPGTPYYGVSSAGYRWVTVIVPASATAPSSAAARPAGIAAAPVPPRVLGLVEELLAAMRSWDPPAADPVEEPLAERLRSGWRSAAEWALAHATRLPAPRVGRLNAVATVEAAEAVLVRRMGEVVYLDELVEELGVPARTLEAAFRSTLAMTPMRYLELLRAHAVFSALRQHGADAPRTVQEAAARAGVLHAARFAARYRGVFGETPAKTLRDARRAGADPAAP